MKLIWLLCLVVIAACGDRERAEVAPPPKVETTQPDTAPPDTETAGATTATAASTVALTNAELVALLEQTGFIVEHDRRVVRVLSATQPDPSRIDVRFAWRKEREGEATALLRRLPVDGWTVMEVKER
jgi:hypothetical protein